MMHRDLVKLEWGGNKLMERLALDDPRVEGPQRWRQALDHWASYVDISEPHEDADCPFGHSPVTFANEQEFLEHLDDLDK